MDPETKTGSRMTAPAQLTLDKLWPCPACKGTGIKQQPVRIPDGWMVQNTCRVCNGAGTVTYDPNDFTGIPY
jgi:DnaJ-class molecular chaperone